MPPIRVLLVDDHSLFRDGLRALLATEKDYVVVGQASDARSATELARTALPDIAVLDIELPGANGIALARDVMRICRRCRVLMLTMHQGEHYVIQALDSGVAGYALKSQSPVEVLEALHALARGNTYLAPTIPQWIVERQSRKRRGESVPGDPLDELSRREREVFDLVVRGFTNEAVSKELGISVKTVETHRARINRKLGVHSPGELVRFAAVRGLVGAA